MIVTTNSNASLAIPQSGTQTSINTTTLAPELTVTTTVVAVPQSVKLNNAAQPSAATVAVTSDKLWSSVMTGGDGGIHPPPYHSPQFQHEFPSLSAGEGASTRPTDTQYGPGPSLRPQTEGSWIQGGSRSGADTSSQVVRNSLSSGGGDNLAALGGGPQLLGQAGPQHSLPPQYHGIMPQFVSTCYSQCIRNINITFP